MKTLLVLISIFFFSNIGFADTASMTSGDTSLAEDGQNPGEGNNEENPEEPLPEEPPVDELKGSVDGYSVRNGDDQLDFGLVIPALPKAKILDFSLASVLSPKTSVIRAAGQRINVPSNLSLPQQNERYLFFTIRINKPQFELPIVPTAPPTSLVVLEGRFPFSSTVDALRGGDPLFSVINDFDFRSFSVEPLGEDLRENLDMTVGENLVEGEKMLFTDPAEPDRDYVTVALSLSSSVAADGTSLYYPIDIKTLEQPEELYIGPVANTPVLVSVPKSTFDSSAEGAVTAPLPFSLTWNDANPVATLPLAKDFITRGDGVLLVDTTALYAFKILGYSLTYLDVDQNIISQTNISAIEVPSEVSAPEIEGATRIRLDIFATDPDPIVASEIDLSKSFETLRLNTKYITRYEEDLN